jgi:hypothetical protein
MTDRLAAVIRGVPIKLFDNSGAICVIGRPDYYWGDPTAQQRNAQIGVKRDYKQWLELFRSIMRNATNDVGRSINEADESFRTWLELARNCSLCNDPVANEQKLREDAAQFFAILDILESEPTNEIILIPDTNSLVGTPDPSAYRTLADSDTFVFLLLPTVFSELDALKNHHKNPDFREKAKNVITRIKGWRKQGDLNHGVTVDRTITVRAIAIEPVMENAISWLDPKINDDRILASVLEVLASHPTANVTLVTGDINLLNKADVARIPHAEI